MSIEKSLAEEVISIIRQERDKAYHKGFTKGIQHAVEKETTENIRTLLPLPEDTKPIDNAESLLIGVYQAYEQYADAMERFDMEKDPEKRGELRHQILACGTALITAVTTHLDAMGFDEESRISAQIRLNEENHPWEEGRLHD